MAYWSEQEHEGRPPVEPSAEIRILARSLREMYLALVREGFTPGEAQAIMRHMLRAAAEAGRPREEGSA